MVNEPKFLKKFLAISFEKCNFADERYIEKCSFGYHYSKYARIKRISQGTDSTEEDFHDIYEEASAIATGVLGSMQTLARTANCKRVQIHNLAERMRKM